MATQRAGPELPPHLLAQRKRKAEEPISLAPTITQYPSLPTAARTTNLQSHPLESASKKSRTYGPAPPPAPLDLLPEGSQGSASDSDENDDNDFGPALPKLGIDKSDRSGNDDGIVRTAGSVTTAQKEKGVRRDDWMTMPPKQDDLAARMDPTKIKARGFNTAKGARGPSGTDNGNNAMWTETPEEKRKRLENEVLGVVEMSSNTAEDKGAHRSRKEDEEKARQIQEHNVKHRSKSLYEQHQGSTRKEKEDDPSKRVFNYEKDMTIGSKVGYSQRKELLNKAAGFSSKFSSGKYL